MSDDTIDRKATRIQVSAEETRKNEAARVQLAHQKEELKLQRARKEMLLKEERRQARDRAKLSQRLKRQNARKNIVSKIGAALPTIGRRAMIAGPILAPMTVAWIGQIGFARGTLGWPIEGAIVFAAAWELTTAFAGWMYHQARKDGDRGALFRFATWVFACAAGAMNYWHACPVITERLNAQTIRQHVNLDPNPKAVSYGAMSLVGIALWELYSSLIHRKELRAKGIVSSARPRFGILRWLRFTRITWHAWSLSVRHGIRTVDAAWAEAVAAVEKIDAQKAVAKKQKRLAKDQRPEVRVTVVRTVTRTVPPPKTTLRLYRIDQPATTPVATTDHLTAIGHRPVVATTPARGLPAPKTTPRATGDQVDATAIEDHPGNRTRPAEKTTRKTGRVQVDATTKAQPSAEDNQRAVAAFLKSVEEGRPLSKRALAKQFGFSPSWALKRIQEAGPRPVGGGRRDGDHVDATTPKDHPVTSEVKTG
jgi:hypothetical protein